jgi:hypothetical protein
MKKHRIINELVVESTDQYQDIVSLKWLPVPKFWIGDFVRSHHHDIRDNQGRPASVVMASLPITPTSETLKRTGV